MATTPAPAPGTPPLEPRGTHARKNVAGIVNREMLEGLRQSQPAADLEDLQQAPLSFRLIRRLLGFTRPYKRQMRWLLFSVFLRGAQLPLLAWAIGAIINGPVAQGDAHGLKLAVIAFIVFACLTEINFHFRIKLSQQIGELVVHDIRAALFHHWLRLTMGYFQNRPVGSLISRLTGDAENVRVGVQNVLFVSLVQGGQMLGCAVLMAFTDVWLFLCALGIAPLVWLLDRLFRRRLSAAYRAQSDSFSRISATMAESVGGMRVTQSFSRQAVNEELFRELVADHARYNFNAARAAGTFLPLLELGSQLFVALLLLLGGWRALQPDIGMPIGRVIQFFFLTGLFFQPIVTLGQLFNDALTAMAGAEKLFRVLDTQPDWQEAPEALRPERLRGQVEFRDVWFAYQPDRPVLRGLSFAVAPGTCVALVGATGSGKTTLAGLIAKFHLPTQGQVLLDGIDIRELHSDAIHACLGVVPQQNFLFLGSILDNISVVRPQATREQVVAALGELDCLDLIAAIPGGLDAQVGEHGAGLSLGQRQMICFARALIANPALLILDEATSAVDPLTEQRTQKALFKLIEGRTSFIVAHRLSTIRHADLVLVMDHGRIVERGSPGELIARGGAFAALWAKGLDHGKPRPPV
ncbi:MAG: yheH [Verrucomicrobiaceae bacterium]|nr:yheH [Verrucomicrobiaceae bacterium]